MFVIGIQPLDRIAARVVIGIQPVDRIATGVVSPARCGDRRPYPPRVRDRA